MLDEKVSVQTAIIGHGLGNKRVLLRRGEGDIDVMAIDNSWLGLYPTWEGVAAQLGALLVVLGSYFLARELQVGRLRRRAALAEA